MAKQKIVDLQGNAVSSLPTVKGVHPLGSQILVGLLNAEELFPGEIQVTSIKKEIPQGIVMQLGPMVNKDFGVEVGQRVVIVGSFTPVPTVKDERELILVEAHCIKCHLV